MKKEILDGQFTLIEKTDDILVWDNQLDEEYILHKVPFAKGEFISKIKEEIKEFEKQIKVYIDQKEELIEYIESTFSLKAEYPFDEDTPVFKKTGNKKWFALMMKINVMKLGLLEDREVNIIDIKLKPDQINELVDNKKYFRGYHMNKKHWFTMCLDGSVPINTIKEFINQSYQNTK